MTALKVKVETITNPSGETLELDLKCLDDGWTYVVQGLDSGPLPLHWRSETMDGAEEKLKASYDESIWTITVVEES
jgi:hypothetical protein